jgi:hypothetical protein
VRKTFKKDDKVQSKFRLKWWQSAPVRPLSKSRKLNCIYQLPNISSEISKVLYDNTHGQTRIPNYELHAKNE